MMQHPIALLISSSSCNNCFCFFFILCFFPFFVFSLIFYFVCSSFLYILHLLHFSHRT